MLPDRPSLRPTVITAAVGVAGAAAAAAPAPGSLAASLLYVVPVLFCTVAVAVAVPRVPAGFRHPWRWLLVAQVLYLAGEVLFLVSELRGEERWPTPGDVFYLLAYVPMAVGLLGLNRQRASVRYRGSLLDAGVLSLSAATLFGVFVVLPVASDGSQPLLVRVVSSAYPVADVLLVFLMARLLTGPGARPPAFWFLVVAMSCTIAADVLWNLQQLTVGGLGSGRLLNTLWLLYYAGIAAAAVNARRTWDHHPATDTTGGLTAPKLFVLAVAAALPSAVLVTLSLLHHAVPAGWLAAGSVALIALVVARVWDLLQQLRAQSHRLAALARTDPLTGIANRRTLEHELHRVCCADRDDDVFVALLDLDHFKAYNDSRGHQAGDELLKAASAAWADALGHGFLARWGGEEFVAVVTGDAEDAARRVDALRAVVPDGQTCSIGLARWEPGEPVARTLRRADEALYAAKSAGRDRLARAVPTA
ncbi:GGDEF domain-containing protein [Kineococcus sp. SYSU DK002]|uniref:GGDEF domain-containing protein n=1 Tax=Kineococcus sp. SYSU DK002 TaxID=3383123 RepID=UPI003D7C3915